MYKLCTEEHLFFLYFYNLSTFLICNSVKCICPLLLRPSHLYFLTSTIKSRNNNYLWEQNLYRIWTPSIQGNLGSNQPAAPHISLFAVSAIYKNKENPSMILHEYNKKYLQPRIFLVPNKKKKASTSKHTMRYATLMYRQIWWSFWS